MTSFNESPDASAPGGGSDGGAPPRPGGEGRGPRRDGPPVRVVRYGAMAWVGEFTYKSSLSLGWSCRVVIQTDRGIEIGETVGPPCGVCAGSFTPDQIQAYIHACGQEFCRPRAGRILRLATDQDLNEQRHLNAHVHEDIDQCATLAEQLNLDLKVVTAEHLLGGERIVFYFRAPARVDFRQLVKELAQRYRTRIEMRQVGARDEARLVADFEICGRECCCKNFLKKLRPVNMKMAKLQKSTLDPSKVSGRCGRLRCCLRYEHVGYEELVARLPRVGSRVETAFGPATVIDRQILTQLVMTRTDDERITTIPVEEIRAFNLPPAPPKEEPSAPAGGPPAQRPERPERRGKPRRERPPRPRTGAPTAPPAAPGRPEPDSATAPSRFEPETPVVTEDVVPTPPTELPASASPAGPPIEGGPPRPAGSGHRRRRRRRRPGGGDRPPAPGGGERTS